MESPFKATPRLNVKESKEFLKKVEEGLNNPMGPVPTPGIDRVIKMILKDAGIA